MSHLQAQLLKINVPRITGPVAHKDTCHFGLPLSAIKNVIFPDHIKRIFLWLTLALFQHGRQHQEWHLGCSTPTPSSLLPSGHICMAQLPGNSRQQNRGSKWSFLSYPNDSFLLIAGQVFQENKRSISQPLWCLWLRNSKTTGWSLLLQHVFMC